MTRLDLVNTRQEGFQVDKVNMHEAKTHLSRLVQRVAGGERIIIARAGKPVAMLVPYEQEKPVRRLGVFRGQVHIADDFDELPEDIARAFEGDKI